MYPLGHKDLDSPSEERSPSTSSPSSRDEVLETERPEDDSSEGLDNAKPLVQSIVGLDGFREFIMLPIWTVNDFTSTIKVREKYQIPINIPLRLPYMSEKCYYKGAEGIEVYE